MPACARQPAQARGAAGELGAQGCRPADLEAERPRGELTREPARIVGAGEASGFAPAVEYGWSSSMGVLPGARAITGHDTTTTITPAIAFNCVH